MNSVEVLTVDDDARWRDILPSSMRVFAGVEFARLHQAYSGMAAKLLVVRGPTGVSAYSWFERPVAELPFASSSNLVDTSTGDYSGPIRVEGEGPWTGTEIRDAFHDYSRDRGVVTESMHLNPFRTDSERSEWESFNREVVWIDLTRPLPTMWAEDFSHACRKNINRARAAGVTVRPAASHDDIREFHRIYIGTMQRNSAQARYHYPMDFFLRYFDELSEHSLFLLAEQAGKVVAATLYLSDDENMYSYLGGADQEFQHLRPTNQVVHDAIQWGQQRGRKRLILGGGYQPDDGIFRFKSSFSPLRAQFNVFRRVHLAEQYAELTRLWSQHYGAVPGSAAFPAYRAAPPVAGTD